MSKGNILILSFLIFALPACNKVQFETLNKQNVKTFPFEFEKNPDDLPTIQKSAVLKISVDRSKLKQESYMSATVVTQLNNKEEVNLDQLEFFQNGVKITDFSLSKVKHATSYSMEPLQVVFVIDNSGSMASVFRNVKQKVAALAEGFAQENMKAEFCLVTYRDKVTKFCNQFFNDDPTTDHNENLENFHQQLELTSAGFGGYSTENTLGGLMSAAQETSWSSEARKVIVLISDQGDFWYAPGNSGEAGEFAPYYQEVLEQLKSIQAQTFVISLSGEGLDRPFENLDSIVKFTGGEHFSFAGLTSRYDTSGWDLVFDSIVAKVASSFVLTYSLEKNNLSVPSSEPAREITVVHRGLDGTDMEFFYDLPFGAELEIKKVFNLEYTELIYSELNLGDVRIVDISLDSDFINSDLLDLHLVRNQNNEVLLSASGLPLEHPVLDRVQSGQDILVNINYTVLVEVSAQ